MAGRVHFPFIPASYQHGGERIRRMYESCRGGFCSRSGSPEKFRPPLWEPKYPYQHSSSPTHQKSPRTHQLSPARPQTAPTISTCYPSCCPQSTFTTTYHCPSEFGPPPPLPKRPNSAHSEKSQRSHESCQYSNCSRSPCLTPRTFDEPIYPYERSLSLSPPGWPYSAKRRTRRGRWWDKDWHISKQYTQYQNPELQQCGCHKSRIHSGSRTPSPKRSPRTIGIEYHFNRIANGTQCSRTRTPTPKRMRGVKVGVNHSKGENQFEGFGHHHQYQQWSCSPSPFESRSGTPTTSGRRTPSPFSSAPGSARPYAPTKQRPQTPRQQRPQTPRQQRPQTPRQQTPQAHKRLGGDENGGGDALVPYVNSHGHCHTYNAWSCSPSNRNTPKNQSPPRSRDPTPPPTCRMSIGSDANGSACVGGTTTIKVSYTPCTVDQSTATEDYAHDLNLGLRPGGLVKAGTQSGQQEGQQANPLESNSFGGPGHLLHPHPHCHHYHHLCPTCGHHGHHGPTLFSLAPHSTISSGSLEAQVHHHHHHCHCFHHHHH